MNRYQKKKNFNNLIKPTEKEKMGISENSYKVQENKYYLIEN